MLCEGRFPQTEMTHKGNSRFVCKDTVACQSRVNKSSEIPPSVMEESPLVLSAKSSVQLVEELDKAQAYITPEPESFEPKAKKGYIVTSVVSNAQVDWNALGVLKTLAKTLDYELIVTKVKWGSSTDYDSAEHLITTEQSLDLTVGYTNVYLNSDLNINANAATPLSGLAGIAGSKHMVIPHPVRYLETTASPKSVDCRVMVTTGTISDLSHTSVNNRVSSVTKFHSCVGAVVIQDSDYPVTPINIDTKNYTVDFEGKTYTTESLFKSLPAAYLYLPDMHTAHGRPEYQNSLIKECILYGVDSALGGDMFDGSSLLHHDKDRIGFFANRMNLFHELELMTDFVKQLDAVVNNQVYLIIGNHETFADRFWGTNFKDLLDKTSKEEQVYLLKGMAYVIENSELSNKGINYSCFMDYFLNTHQVGQYLKIAPSGLTYKDISLGNHGNEYLINRQGARACNYKICAGHTHAALIWRNYYNAGYGGILDPSYQNGMSKAAPAHIFVNKEGKRQMRPYLPREKSIA